MPDLKENDYGENLSPYLREWEEYYLSKGCGIWKARFLADKKVRIENKRYPNKRERTERII